MDMAVSLSLVTGPFLYSPSPCHPSCETAGAQTTRTAQRPEEFWSRQYGRIVASREPPPAVHREATNFTRPCLPICRSTITSLAHRERIPPSRPLLRVRPYARRDEKMLRAMRGHNFASACETVHPRPTHRRLITLPWRAADGRSSCPALRPLHLAVMAMCGQNVVQA